MSDYIGRQPASTTVVRTDTRAYDRLRSDIRTDRIRRTAMQDTLEENYHVDMAFMHDVMIDHYRRHEDGGTL